MSTDRWYVPGSVLNALWGNIMPRLAASVWRGAIRWPPNTTPDVVPIGNGETLKAYPVDEKAMPKLYRQLVKIAFRRSDSESWSQVQRRYVKAAKERERLNNAQRSTLVTTEYFHPGAAARHLTNRPPEGRFMPLRVIAATGYDFVLSELGLDVFVPPKPGADRREGDTGGVDGRKEEDAARKHVLELYKFRDTSQPPIGLPRAPATAFPPAGSRPQDDYYITIPQLTAPSGAFQLPDRWTRGLAKSVDWWLSGALYRGIMAAYPRIVASKWYEEVAWSPRNYKPGGKDQTYRQRFYKKGGLKQLIEERVETVLPGEVNVFVKARPRWVPANAPGWNPRDLMVTSEGLYFPDPGPAPPWSELAKAIEVGIAGNPVFTDTGPGGK